MKVKLRAKLHLASDVMLHKALPANELQINSCTSFAPEENIQEKIRPRLIHMSFAPKRPCKELSRLRLIASNYLNQVKLKIKREKNPDGSALWLLHLQQARASGDKKQQNQKLNLVHQCILLQR
jgi:hypothetical protein